MPAEIDDPNPEFRFPFTAALFDMDGTLVDSEPVWLASERAVMQRFGVQWTAQDQANVLGGPVEKALAYMTKRAREAGGAATTDQVGDLLINDMVGRLRSAPPLVHDGAEVLLRRIRAAGLPTALVSASPRPLVDAVLDGLRASPAAWVADFDVVVAGDEVVPGKPDPAPYLHAAAVLGVSVTDSLIVEDSATGVQAARASGGFVLAVQHMVELDPGPRSLTVTDLADLELQDLLAAWR